MSSTRLSWTCHCANHLTLHAVLCIFFSGDTIDQVHEIFIFRAMYQQRARLAFPRSKLRACPGPACRSRAPHLECALSRDESRFSLFVKLSKARLWSVHTCLYFSGIKTSPHWAISCPVSTFSPPPPFCWEGGVPHSIFYPTVVLGRQRTTIRPFRVSCGPVSSFTPRGV